ncbi:MAG TPA: ABC transporter permease [Candidatus Tectomicrobia bacterium]|nr:ABC transporter permease [Candidatus Tectomicrobia bacterium]
MSPLHQRFLKHPGAVAGGLITLCFFAIALLAPWLSPYDPLAQDLGRRLQGPSWAHPLGTDDFGRDMLSRVMYGARISLSVGFLSIGIAVTGGLLLGLVAGFYTSGWRRLIDHAIMRTSDILLAFPAVLLAIAIVTAFGPGLRNAMLAIAIIYLPRFIRLVRASILVERAQPYIEAGQALGVSHRRLVFRHLLPNVMSPVIVQATLGLAEAIIEAAALSFLGLGATPPTPEWGAMLSEGRSYLRLAPWVTFFPGMAIFLVVVSFNLLGDGLRDALDPRLRR